MKWYKFDKPSGRLIGQTGEFIVHSDAILEVEDSALSGSSEYHAVPGEFKFTYGPSTGGLMESVGFDLYTPGELIKHVDVEPDFKKRVLKVKGKNIQDALLVVERINGFHSASNSIAFTSAVEDALDIPVSDSTRDTRIVMIELERIRSHLEVLKRVCEPAGFGVPSNQIGYLREEVSRVISKASGHRYFFGSNGVGRAHINPDGVIPALDGIVNEFESIFKGLLQSKIFLNRLQNNGKTRTTSLLGPAARASGLSVDARLDSRTISYEDTAYTPVLQEETDSFARFMVRSREIFQSAEIIRSLKNTGDSGPAGVHVSGSGEGAARIESPQGDLFYYVRIGDGVLEDLRMVSPSYLNILAFKDSMAGNIFTDFHFNWESFGIWISETGVDIR